MTSSSEAGSVSIIDGKFAVDRGPVALVVRLKGGIREMSEVTQPISKCYRLGRRYLIVGIVGAVLFPAMGLTSVYTAYWNNDGSFPHPKIHALVHGILWSGVSILPISLIAAYFRVRISVTDDAITKQGCFFKQQLRLSDISQVTWRRIPQSGKIVLDSSEVCMKLDLSDLTQNDRAELIHTIRGRFDTAIQTGWDRFDTCAQSKRVPTPGEARHTAELCALIVFGFGVIFIACGWFQMGIKFYVSGAACFITTVWYAWRIRRH